jgi:hypothetical protein
MASIFPPTPPSVLTEQEIHRIVEEERLRFRLRSELDPPKEQKTKLLTFLNSPFGLFLLTSVVLAGLTGFFAKIQSHARRSEARNQDIIRMTTELKNRVTWMKEYSAALMKAPGLEGPDGKAANSQAIWWTVFGGPNSYPASAHEFAGLTTYGLLTKLRSLGVTTETNEALKTVVALQFGRTEAGGRVYPQKFLDSQISQLDSYADGVLIPYLDRERKRPSLWEIFF